MKKWKSTMYLCINVNLLSIDPILASGGDTRPILNILEKDHAKGSC